MGVYAGYTGLTGAAAAAGDLPLPVLVTRSSADASSPVSTMACLLLGFSFGEDSGAAAAAVYLLDGSNPSSRVAMDVVMAANTSETASFPWPGVPFRDGLWLVNHAGSWHGSVWFVPLIGGA